MQFLTQAAERHRTIARSMVHSSPHTLTVHVRDTKPQASGASMFADLVTAETALIPHEGIACLWHDAKGLPSTADVRVLQLLGQYKNASAYITIWLEDVLTDDADLYGETLFDVAVHVEYRGHLYKVLASKRHGMANLPPYLLTVVLAGEVRHHAPTTD